MPRHHRFHQLFFIACSLLLTNAPLFSAQGLVAHWSFDSSETNIYFDVSGNGHYVQARTSTPSGVFGGAIPGTGVRGKSINCQGTYSDLLISNPAALCNDTLSLELWFCPKTLTTQCLISQTNSSPAYGYQLKVVDQGHLTFEYAKATSTNLWVTVRSHNLLVANRWHHLVCTFDGITTRLYINGELDTESSDSSGMRSGNLTKAYIGAELMENTAVSNWTNGKIDEFKIYHQILTADTIAALCKAWWPIPEPITVTPSPTFNTKPALRWHKLSNVTDYRVQIAKNAAFDPMLIATTCTDTVYIPSTDLPYGDIYWRVGNPLDTSLWSTTFYFTVQEATVGLPVLHAPDTTSNRKPALTWSKIPNAASYTIQIDTVNSFVNPFMQSVTSDTFYTPTINLPVRTIYWRVMSNLVERYSATDSFCIVSAMVTLVPFDKDTQYTQKPLFAWHMVPAATTYRIQIDTSSSFSNPLFTTLTNDTFYTPTANLPSGKIYWRVNSDAPGSVYSGTGLIVIIPSTSTSLLFTRTGTNGSMHGKYIIGWGIIFTFDTPESSPLTIRMYSPAGKLVATVTDKSLSASPHQLFWDGKNANGKLLGRGSYLFEARTAHKTVKGKFIVAE